MSSVNGLTGAITIYVNAIGASTGSNQTWTGSGSSGLSATYTFVGSSLTAIVPAASSNAGVLFNIKSISAGITFTISANQGFIDGQQTWNISDNYISMQLMSNGTNWYII